MPPTTFDPIKILFFCVGILFAVTFQGAAQGIAIAIFQGNPANDDDRPQLNLNFFAHLDPLALLVFFLGGFGWAKPPRVEDQEFKNPRIAWLIIAFVSAFTNLLVAVTVSVFVDIVGTSQAFRTVMLVNATVFVYHFLVPIPPLASSRIIYALLTPKHRRIWQWYSRLGPFLLLAMVIVERFTDIKIFDHLTKPFIDAIMTFCTTS